MRSIKTPELIGKLKGKAVFSVQDVERFAGCGPECARQALRRLKAAGHVRRIERNAYTAVDSIFAIASGITYPSYISFWSASAFMGYTDQVVNTIQVATSVRKKPITFEKYRIKFVPIKAEQLFGYKKIRTEEGEVLVAENEKLLVDAFIRPGEFGNFDEIVNAFRGAKVSAGRLAEYVNRAGGGHLAKRVGFLAQKEQGIDISGMVKVDRNYVRLNPLSGGWKRIDKKWRVKV